MAMAVDSRQQLSGMPYDHHMRYPAAPQFTNPWVSSPAAAASGQVYATSIPQGADPARHSLGTAPAVSMPSYHSSAALPALSLPSGTQPMVDSVFGPLDSHIQGYATTTTRPYGAEYPSSAASATSASPAGAYTAATPAAQHYATSADYAHQQQTHQAHQQQKLSAYNYADRRASHPSVAPNVFFDEALRDRQSSSLVDFDRLNSATEAERNSFSDALDASRGMVAMSQDITPRNIYGTQNNSHNSSTDSYGFPSTHSAHSSISSASSGYPGGYYGSSVSEASYGDYSSAGESVDIPSRTLPRPNSLIGGQLPPAPQSMMGSFSSKVSSSSQKKHKCKICDKRFTRPSSLQTHMYSHTGEKPFACDVEGCGRHFSVVSNLRRHKKVHKGESDHLSPDEE